MKRTVIVATALLVLGLILGPVIVRQLSSEDERHLQGPRLSELEYHEVSFTNQDLELAGLLFVPDGDGPFPAVVVIHGSGSSTRDNPWYLSLVTYLQDHGVAVLLPDKRGSGDSGGDWRNASFEDLAGDALAAVEYLQSQDQVRVSQVGLVGMSQGGQIAPLAASQSDQVGFVVNVVGSAVPMHEALLYEETNNLREFGILPGLAGVIARGSSYVIRELRQPEFWDAVGNYDSLPYWRELKVPALVLYGGEDPNTPSQASKERLESLGVENLQVVVYPGSGHALQDPPGQGDRVFREQALMDIQEFIDMIAPAQPEFAQPEFVFQGEDPGIPVVSNNPSPAIENRFINPGAVLIHDGQFHMFFNSFTEWPGIVEVGYMTSPDGYQWEMVQDEPVLVTDQIPFGDGAADISSVIITEDGTWVLYFHTVHEGEIGRATAGSPVGPYQVDPEPVLTPGSQGEWDDQLLAWPSVVVDGDELRMYYGAQTLGGTAIGFASSSDGINWTKYNDPSTAEAPYAESDPVLGPVQDWESIRVDRPRVVLSPDGWVMLYQGGITVDTRGLAISNDGISWVRYEDNPLFSTAVFPIPNARTWDTALVHHNDRYLYLMELGALAGTDLYLTVHEGTLRR